MLKPIAHFEWRRLLAWHGLLLLASFVGCVWVVYRQRVTGSDFYDFLIWNLFLAWIPFWAATFIRLPGFRKVSALLQAGAGIVWFLFLPNAAYLVTDLYHFGYIRGKGVWPWSDLLMILTFAWTGLFLGFLSIYLVHENMKSRFGTWGGWLFVAAVLPLNAAGVYLGRVLRWNSWDVFTDPWKLLSQLSVFLERSPYKFIGMMTVFGILGYLTIYMLIGDPPSKGAVRQKDTG